jgi:hypothetical protein
VSYIVYELDGEGKLMATTSPPHRLRDVTDVRQYVRHAVDRIAPATADRRGLLQAHGVRAVVRIERALPPGVPLTPVLEEVLTPRLAALDSRLSSEIPPVAAAA